MSSFTIHVKFHWLIFSFFVSCGENFRCFNLPVQNGSWVVVDVAIVVTSVSLSAVAAVGRSINVDAVVVVAFILSNGILQWNLSSQNSRNLKFSRQVFQWRSKNFFTKDSDGFRRGSKQSNSHQTILLRASEFWWKWIQLLAVQAHRPHLVCRPIHRCRWLKTDLWCSKTWWLSKDREQSFLRRNRQWRLEGKCHQRKRFLMKRNDKEWKHEEIELNFEGKLKWIRSCVKKLFFGDCSNYNLLESSS